MPSRKSAYQPSPQYIAAFKALHEPFSQLIRLKPWEIVDASILLGVRHPQSGNIWYAYFMGELGEVIGFNLYSADAVGAWRYAHAQMLNEAEDFDPVSLLLQTFMQVTAVKKSDLQPDVKALHEAAGITAPRGKAGYTEAISYRAGYAPDMAEEAQLEIVAALIPGFIYLLQRIDGGLDIDTLQERDETAIAHLVPDGWEASTGALPPPSPAEGLTAHAPENEGFWEELKALPGSDERYVLRAALLPIPFADDDGVGTYIVTMIALGAKSGAIAGVTQVPAPDWKTDAAGGLKELLLRAGYLPKGIITGDSAYQPVIEHCAATLGIPVQNDERAADSADALLEHLSTTMQMRF